MGLGNTSHIIRVGEPLILESRLLLSLTRAFLAIEVIHVEAIISESLRFGLNCRLLAVELIHVKSVVCEGLLLGCLVGGTACTAHVV